MSSTYSYLKDEIEVANLTVPDFCPKDAIVMVYSNSHIYEIRAISGIPWSIVTNLKLNRTTQNIIHPKCFIKMIGLARLKGNGTSRVLVLANSKTLFPETDMDIQKAISNLEIYPISTHNWFSTEKSPLIVNWQHERGSYLYIKKDDFSNSISNILSSMGFLDLDYMIAQLEYYNENNGIWNFRSDIKYYNEIKNKVGFSGLLTYYIGHLYFSGIRLQISCNFGGLRIAGSPEYFYGERILKHYKSEWKVWKYVYLPQR